MREDRLAMKPLGPRGWESSRKKRFDPRLRSWPILMGGLPVVFSLALWGVLLAWVAIPTPQAQTAPAGVKIAGRLLDAPSGAKVETARVVLVQYTMDARSQIQERKIEAVSPGQDGRFVFKPVTGKSRGMYRITATLGEYRTGTGLFPLAKPGETKSFELRFPGLSEDRSALRIEEGLVLFEIRKTSVRVTELVRLLNPTQNTMEGVRTPLELFIPKAAEALEMLSPPHKLNRHRRMGTQLLVSGNLPPGRTTVAFRYSIPIASGTLTLEKRYPHPVENFLVLSPEDGLTLRSQGFTREQDRTIEKIRFRSWALKSIEAGRKITLNLTGFPQLIEDRSALRIQEVRIAFEPSGGGAFVTEVVHYINPTRDIMEGEKTPFEIPIPAEAESVEMIYTDNQKETHRREGARVLVYSNLPPGRTTVAFRYRLAAGWGSLSLQKRYGLPVANFFVLSPEGLLTLNSEGFARDDIRTFEKTRFDSWVRKGIEAGQTVTLTVSGLPIRQSVLLPLIGVFLAIMAGVVVWYWRKRIPREEKAASVSPAQG